MKILSIGNSFSQDATRYLHNLSASGGVSVKTVNLYIGGCSLKTHYYNILENAAAYTFEFNGESTGLKVTVKDALMSDDWDIVTLQQVSTQSPRFETYQPYLTELAAYVRRYVPHAALYMHQTWAYEDGSERLRALGFEKSMQMLDGIRASYAKAASDIHAAGIIPDGEAMMRALENGMEKVHRDTFHASLGAGRFLLALTWYGFFTGKPVAENPFSAFDVPVTPEEIALVKKSVGEVLGQ